MRLLASVDVSVTFWYRLHLWFLLSQVVLRVTGRMTLGLFPAVCSEREFHRNYVESNHYLLHTFPADSAATISPSP